MIQILELFGGIGAPRKALVNLGIDVKAIDYVEIDQKAVKSYNAIFERDLAYKTQSVVGYTLKPDILINGSPCQDFSIAGHQKGADEGSEARSSLMWETINIIEQMGVWKPRIVIWENVKNVLSKHMLHNFNRYLQEMEKLGYTNSFETLKRKTFKHIVNFLETEVQEHYTVTQPSMLKLINGTSNSSFNGRVEIIKDHCKTITCKQMRSPNSGVIDLGNGKYRYLTERECWRLQGYDDVDYEAALNVHPGIPGKLNGALYKQAGNSIPVTVFEALFEQMLGIAK